MLSLKIDKAFRAHQELTAYDGCRIIALSPSMHGNTQCVLHNSHTYMCASDAYIYVCMDGCGGHLIPSDQSASPSTNLNNLILICAWVQFNNKKKKSL